MSLYEKLKEKASGAIEVGKEKARTKYREFKEEGEREDRIYNEAYKKGREKYLRRRGRDAGMGRDGGSGVFGSLGGGMSHVGGHVSDKGLNLLGGLGERLDYTTSSAFRPPPSRKPKSHRRGKTITVVVKTAKTTKSRRGHRREPEYPDWW